MCFAGVGTSRVEASIFEINVRAGWLKLVFVLSWVSWRYGKSMNAEREKLHAVQSLSKRLLRQPFERLSFRW